MAIYLIGDVQGCDVQLGMLLDKLDFSPSRDTAFLLGDLVNRGPDSAAVLRRLMALGSSARCLLGNHDLHLLAVAQGASSQKRLDTLNPILQASDASAMLDWLRQQPLAMHQHGVLMVHAGVLPAWSAKQTMDLAQEVETVLAGPDWADFMHHMYGNQPACWDDALSGFERLRCIVNALTRLRFCTPTGEMEFTGKQNLDQAPSGCVAWFDAPSRLTAQVPIAFGHWSTLHGLQRPDVVCLDTGCVWGGPLSALCVNTHGAWGSWVSVEGPGPIA